MEKGNQMYEIIGPAGLLHNDNKKKAVSSQQQQRCINNDHMYDNMHELQNIKQDEERVRENTQARKNASPQSKSSKNGLSIAIIALLILILMLLVSLLGIEAFNKVTESHCNDGTNALKSYHENTNFTKWADSVAHNVFQLLSSNRQPGPNFTEWADGVAHNVFQLLSSNRQPGPNFTEWADSVAQNVFQLQNNTSPQWAKEVYQNNSLIMSQLLNTTHFTAKKVDRLVENEVMHAKNTTQLLFANNWFMHQLFTVTSNSAAKLTNIAGTLSNIKDTGVSTFAVADDVLQVVEELLVLHKNITSCEDIKRIQPLSPPGYYYINNRTVYCNMGELCGSREHLWKRLAYLNMSDTTQNCPSGFKLYQSGGVRACGRPTSSDASCQSVIFPSNGISYSQVCGRVVGYHYGHPDAIGSSNTGHNNISSYYVDGVSITHGSPRKHVWTLMNGYSETCSSSVCCPCNTGSTVQVQSFIGSHYYCESGNPLSSWTSKLYTSDPLWDGQGCGGVEGPCCTSSSLPWFHRQYSTTTTDYLELRVCQDSSASEDTPVSFYEIYVK